jgi:hypothetical protein
MLSHRGRLWICAVLVLVVVLVTLVYGFDYYRMSAGDRLFNEKHKQLGPSGSIGLKLGMFGVGLFVCLYAYPVRKRWKWLQRFGKTRHWLDFHILLGISVPLIITLHSSFKFQGIAGVAYWLMIAVMLSGFVGRYIYAQIPKSFNETALTLDEIEKLSASVEADLEKQTLLAPSELNRVLKIPEALQVERMSMLGALTAMVWRDVTMPFRTSRLRRATAASFLENCGTLFGFRSSGNRELENAIRLVKRQGRLNAKLAFLGRANQLFQLWHVVHRPFSYSFAVLACLHIGLVMLMGYF